MGNEQSAPAPRRPGNKLSKPKTNSSLPIRPTPAAENRRSSVVNEVGISKIQYSSLSVDAVVSEAGGKGDEPTKKKRMSIFRSRSSLARASQLDIASGVNIEYLNESPTRSPAVGTDEWSRNSSVVDFKQQQYYNAPPQRYDSP